MLPEWFDVLVARSREADGQPPFSDQSLVDARTGARELLTVDEVAAALLGETEVELVVDPDARRRGNGTRLLEAVISRSQPGLLAWSHGDHPGARVLADRYGFEPVRRLLQLRRGLGPGSGLSSSSGLGPTSGLSLSKSHQRVTPEEVSTSSTHQSSSTPDSGLSLSKSHQRVTPGEVSTSSTHAAVRAFVPGRDDAAWLALNSRAFAFHAEQGSVSQSDLDELRREHWFDADDFLVLEEAGTMIGYCWLKVDHAIGELYVVGVDPERQGEGLGRRLVEAGLSRLRERGILTASLYVEADNTPAVHLYESFGFTEYAADVQYRLTGLTRRSS